MASDVPRAVMSFSRDIAVIEGGDDVAYLAAMSINA